MKSTLAGRHSIMIGAVLPSYVTMRERELKIENVISFCFPRLGLLLARLAAHASLLWLVLVLVLGP